MPPVISRVRSPRNPGVMALAQWPGASFIGQVLGFQICLRPAHHQDNCHCQKSKLISLRMSVTHPISLIKNAILLTLFITGFILI